MKRGRRPVLAQSADGRRVFRRYKNRQIYDAETRSYVSSSALIGLEKGTFVVIYVANGADITDWSAAMAELEARAAVLREEATRLGIV